MDEKLKQIISDNAGMTIPSHRSILNIRPRRTALYDKNVRLVSELCAQRVTLGPRRVVNGRWRVMMLPTVSRRMIKTS